MKRALSLKKETLAELASDDLRSVAGGVVSAGPTCYTCVVTNCRGICNTTITGWDLDTFLCHVGGE